MLLLPDPHTFHFSKNLYKYKFSFFLTDDLQKLPRPYDEELKLQIKGGIPPLLSQNGRLIRPPVPPF